MPTSGGRCSGPHRAALGVDGDVALYEPCENHHENQILDLTSWPAAVGAETRDAAHAIARGVLEGLDVVGVAPSRMGG